MSKNIVICLDGTWNDKDDPDALSNVALLHQMCRNDDATQLAYYDTGVGTSGWYDRKLGGVHGVGLSDNVREAYAFLAQHFAADDKVFIFGFSRGAYTARSLAGLLYRCGLLEDGGDLKDRVGDLYDAYRERDDDRMAAHKAANQACPVAFLGVWDTVGALGIPVSFLRGASAKALGFHDTGLSPEVASACHALAADEKREAFEPTLWSVTPDNASRIRQVWFPGVHSDVGGGYAERHHSDVALRWMVDHATNNGLLLTDAQPYDYQPDLGQSIHESAYKMFGREIGTEMRDGSSTASSTPSVHWSIPEKMRLTGDYMPLALARTVTDWTTLAPFSVEQATRR
ncbi:MAG: DUF2235 domain-containing protein [Pseudomonadota bacterium]